MGRLLSQIGLTYLFVLAVVFYLPKYFLYIVLILALLLSFLFLLCKKYRKTIFLPAMAITALVACCVNMWYTSCVFEKTVEKYDGCTVMVTANLLDEPREYYGDYEYFFETQIVSGQKEKLRFKAYFTECLDIDPLDTVELEVELIATDKASHLSDKCFLIGTLSYEAPYYKVIKHNHHKPYYHAIRLRQCVRELLREVLSDDAFALCSALLIGDKNAIPYNIRQMFVKAGVSHLIVVSGMHFSILASGFFMLVRKFYRYRVIAATSAVVFIFLYMSVTGYSASVVRSGVMLLVYSLGIIISRESYPYNSLGLAALIVTLFNPYSVGDIGLILSFSSTFAILALSPALKRKFCKRIKFIKYKRASRVKAFFAKRYNKAVSTLVSILCMNISAFAVSLPLSIIFFDAVSSVSILSTFVLYFPVQFLLIITLVIALVCFIPFMSFAVPILAFCAEVLTNTIYSIVEFFAELPFSYLKVSHDYVYLWVIMGFALLLFTLYSRGKHRVKAYFISIIALFLVGYISCFFINESSTTLKVYDVDDGMAVVYSDDEVNAVLAFDCNISNANKVIGKLEGELSSIDFYSCVSNDTNSTISFDKLTKVFAISDVLLYDTDSGIFVDNTVCEIHSLADTKKVEVSKNSCATYLEVDGEYIAYLETDFGSVMILPDFIDALDIPEKYRSADIIVTKYCPENYELLSCETLVISNKKAYAVPIMKKLSSISERVLLTADDDIKIIMEV